MANKYRAEQVGSFLRPLHVRQAHAAQAEGKLSLEELRKIEDEAIKKLLEMQKQVGIDVVSDGEMRRGGWASEFSAHVDGYVEGRPAVRLQFNENPLAAAWREAHPDENVQLPNNNPAGQGPRAVLGAPLKLREPLTGHEAPFLKANAGGSPFKVTMPAASYIVARGYNPEISNKQFGNRAGVLKAVSDIINSEIKSLVAAGVPYIQLDNPHYPDYVVDERREQWKALGIDPDVAVHEDVAADNACLDGVDRSNVTFGMHFCRGNGGLGGWHSSGGYDRIAEDVLAKLKFDTLLLEYDTDRAGGFEPLKYIPAGVTAVLGLITTKAGQLEPESVLLSRIEEASKYKDLADLALSPQCGFASTFQGNPLTEDEQRAKLQLVVDTARKVWK